MKKVLVCLTAIACLGVAGTVAHAQCGTLFGECLINGNLDIGTAGGAGDPGTAPPWTLTNVGNATAAQFQPGFADSTGVNGIWYRSFLGSVAAPVDAELAQTTVPVLMDGQYRLTFDYLVEQNFTAQTMVATLSSSGGGIATFDLNNDAPRTTIGGGFVNNPAEVATLLVDASAGDLLTVSLAMTGGVTSGIPGGQSVVADRFSLVRIPEPTSAVLVLIAVLSLVGGARRRR